MKVTSYTILENNIVLKFDTSFNNVNYIKMQSSSEIANYGELDSEEIRIKYSKPKDTINLFITPDCHLLTILVTQVDSKPLYYSYYLSNNNEMNNNEMNKKQPKKDKFDTLLDNIPILKLIPKNNYVNDKNNKNNYVNDKNNYIYNAIKNENIFAKIKRKGDSINGNKQIM